MITAPPSSAPATTAVELKDASVRLAGKRIFGDVELTVGRGQFVAVLGPNGAGKSTLMRAILGLLPLESGSVTVLGRPPAQARPRSATCPSATRSIPRHGSVGSTSYGSVSTGHAGGCRSR